MLLPGDKDWRAHVFVDADHFRGVGCWLFHQDARLPHEPLPWQRRYRAAVQLEVRAPHVLALLQLILVHLVPQLLIRVLLRGQDSAGNPAEEGSGAAGRGAGCVRHERGRPANDVELLWLYAQPLQRSEHADTQTCARRHPNEREWAVEVPIQAVELDDLLVERLVKHVCIGGKIGHMVAMAGVLEDGKLDLWVELLDHALPTAEAAPDRSCTIEDKQSCLGGRGVPVTSNPWRRREGCHSRQPPCD
mmetsp:Transcript_72759/g.168654  ORF Transcript_72759/g.168654 Transcript_72759/m.168654 type:complete len:247 (-) Transcript_72759:888-1628(-)